MKLDDLTVWLALMLRQCALIVGGCTRRYYDEYAKMAGAMINKPMLIGETIRPGETISVVAR